MRIRLCRTALSNQNQQRVRTEGGQKALEARTLQRRSDYNLFVGQPETSANAWYTEPLQPVCRDDGRSDGQLTCSRGGCASHLKNPVFISLQELELRTVRFRIEVPPGQIDYDGKITQLSVLQAEGAAQLLNHSLGEVRVHGQLTARVEAACDRCLEPAIFSIDKQFDFVYMPASESGSSGDEEIEQAAIDTGYYQGGGLELNDVFREVVLLALPMQLTCSEACKGICPDCGQNRNQHDCNCQPQAFDDRWNKLKNLRVEIGLDN